MIKLVANFDDGVQRLQVIHESGGFYDKTKVVWDERVDGPLSAEHEAAVGGLVRSKEGVLSVDDAKLAAQQASEAKKVAEDQARMDAPNNLRTAIRNIDFSAPLNSTQITAILKHVVRLLS